MPGCGLVGLWWERGKEEEERGGVQASVRPLRRGPPELCSSFLGCRSRRCTGDQHWDWSTRHLSHRRDLAVLSPCWQGSQTWSLRESHGSQPRHTELTRLAPWGWVGGEVSPMGRVWLRENGQSRGNLGLMSRTGGAGRGCGIPGLRATLS